MGQSLTVAYWAEGGGPCRMGKATEGQLSLAYPASCESPTRMHYTHQDLRTWLPVLIWESSRVAPFGAGGSGKGERRSMRGVKCKPTAMAGSLVSSGPGLAGTTLAPWWPRLPLVPESSSFPRGCYDSFCWGRAGRKGENVTVCVDPCAL